PSGGGQPGHQPLTPRPRAGQRASQRPASGPGVAQWSLLGSEVIMATAEECRSALESLVGRLAGLDAADRAAYLADRTLSCTVTDLGITFLTKLGPDGAGPVTDATGTDPQANVRFSTNSDELLLIAADPGRFARAWLTGRIKVDASLSDLFRLRKLL